MQYTQQQLDEFKATFAVRRRRQMFATIPFVLVAVLFVTADESTGTTLGGLSLAYAAPVMIAVILGMFAFAFKNWRCPSCNAYMGKAWSPAFCSRCGVPLQ